MKLYKGKEYIVVKKGRDYSCIDITDFTFDDGFEYLSIRKNGHLIEHYSYDVLDDWYCDTGAIYKHYRKEYDLGKIIGEFDNKQDAQDYYNELVGEEIIQEIY